MITKELLAKCTNTPGLATLEELLEYRKFLEEYINMRNLYRDGHGNIDPVGLILESQIDRTESCITMER
jgi:hypothetical protein